MIKTKPLTPKMLAGALKKMNPIYPRDYRVVKCNFSDIIQIFKKYHYKKDHIGGSISFCLVLLDIEGFVVGGSVAGPPRHVAKYKDCVEIRRMACFDSCPKNTESYFLSKVIWFIKKNTEFSSVLSYADTSAGHKGTIYAAANFRMIGKTADSKHVFWKGKRYHPRSINTERPYSYELRKAIKTGDATIETGAPKNIWIYEIKRLTKSYKV